MSIPYKVVKQSFGFDETKTEKYVVKAVTGEMLTFDKVCNQVCQICGAHRGTVSQVVGGLLDVMVNNLDMGHSVQLGEFGILRPGLRTKAQDSEEAANAHAIYRKKVNFVPGKMLKNFLKDVAITRASTGVTSTKKNEDSDSGDDGGSGGWIDPTA
ncbi:DNA-binding protein [Bacteroides sp. 519]|uniref:HU family DNA-binding protein n=1 Tax=Bacteroides sp. 519 TaxID=2302937 RepID=UPI0013D44A97|nr:DNA-binding protein [Bacteroides sp. 519]NDV58975.1 DNA-binding protein [Bacteroides sp. 519]